jgi:dCTP deaminase
MILPAQEIRRLCLQPFPPMLNPFHERSVQNGLSFGLSPAGYDIRIDQDLVLHPGEFKLASAMERFNMPLDVLAIVHDKSTWARRGLCVQNTVIEPGWEGFLTLELTNHASADLQLHQGDPIAQIVFHKLMEGTNQPYRGKYQNQERRPVEALNEQGQHVGGPTSRGPLGVD